MENTKILNLMNKHEKEFITDHKIDLLKCVNAKGKKMSKTFTLSMRIYDFDFAFNTYPCNKGHTIKMRSGHCVICNPKGISFQSREHSEGYLYIAGTKWGQRVKVGCTTNFDKREKYLNEYKGYGFFADWKILAVAKVDEMGLSERQIHNELERYREYGIQYYRGREIKRSNELFRCSYEKSLDILIDLCKINKFYLKIINSDYNKYKFRNLIKLI